jgi:predicted Zn-dependent protease
MVQQVLAAGTPWGDNRLNEYVNRLGQNLARSSGSQQPFTFYVLYNPNLNAQAFPGGYIVVNSGVISLADSEAELASVLAHEIAHVNACDCWSSPSRGTLFELAAVVPTLILGGPVGIALLSAGGAVGPAARARASRRAEERADRRASEYLLRAGYDPRASESFLARVEVEQEHSASPSGGLLATHPRTSDRLRRLEATVTTLPLQDFPARDESEFLRVRKTVRDYDRIFALVTGVRVPGSDTPSPELSRRPPTPSDSTIEHLR